MVISFPRSGANSDKVTLKGAKQCIDGVKARIQDIVDDLVSAFQNKMTSVTAWHAYTCSL